MTFKHISMSKSKPTASDNINININNDDANGKDGYLLLSVSDPTDFKEIYSHELSSHTKLYQEIELNRNKTLGAWQRMIGEEQTHKRSRFFKNYEKLVKQTSSGIETVLEEIADTGKKSDSVYASAINEEELKDKFPNAIYTEDPYTSEQKIAIHEALNADGAVKRGASFWRKFLLGKEITVNFADKKNIEDETKSEVVSSRLGEHPDINKYLNRLREIDDEVKLRKAIQNECDNLFGFGRACLVKLTNDSDYPVRLVPLSSFKLGKVWVDSKTFEFLAVEYLEIQSQDNRNILLASDIIYLTISDDNVTPNTRYYGKSLIFPVLALSETNRVNRERNFPEIIRKKWAATLLIKTSTKNQAKNQQIVDLVNNRAGGTVLIPDMVSAENLKPDTELQGLINYSIESDKKIFRDMELPSVASGLDQQAQTRANAQAEIHIWSESTLEDLRENITDMLREQWYHPNLLKIIQEDVIKNGTDTDYIPTLTAELLSTETLTEQQAPAPLPTLEESVPAQTEVKPPGTPEEEMTLIEKLGFDINSINKLNELKTNISDDELKQRVIEKLANIYVDIYQGIAELAQEDIISLTDEIKYPWKVMLSFKNIIFDNFLDRSAGVIGLLNAGVINEEIALDLSKLEQYKQIMRKARIEKENARIAQMETELKQVRGELLMAKQQQQQQQKPATENVNTSESPQQVEEETAIPPEEEKQGGTANISGTVNRKITSRTTRGRAGA